jgi:hypothetical protein
MGETGTCASPIARHAKGLAERKGVVGRFGVVDQPVRGGPRLLTGPGDRQRDDQAIPGECMGVVTACELGATPLDVSFGLADGRVHSAE